MSNAGQAITSVVGAVVGFYVGGPTGAAYGFQLGLLGGSALFPTQLDGITGPQLEDFETLQADPGAPVFQVFGTAAVPGFRMYLGDVSETTNTEEVGGKGPPEQAATTFQYFQTLGLGLCEGPIAGVTRVWENGTLKYDLRPQFDDESTADYEARVDMSEQYAETFSLYLGDEEQEADPTLELDQGIGNAPAFRGLAYMIFPDRELKPDQGNRHPSFKVEVIKSGDVGACQLDPELVTSVPVWDEADDQNGALELDAELDRVTEVVIEDPEDGTWIQHIRVWDFQGNVLSDDDFVFNNIDGFASVDHVTCNNGARISYQKKGQSGTTSPALNAWYVDGNIVARPVSPARGTRYTRAVAELGGENLIYVPDWGVYTVGTSFEVSETTAYLARYSAPNGIPVGTPSAHIMIDADTASFNGAICGFDDQFIYLYRRGLPGESQSSGSWYAWRIDLELDEVVATFEFPFALPGDSHVRVICGKYVLFRTSTISSTPVLVYEMIDGQVLMEDLGTISGLAQNEFDFPEIVSDNFLYMHTTSEFWRIGSGGAGAGDVAISEILEAICARAGLDSIDVSEHTENFVRGYAITRESTARSAIEPLRMAGLFDLVESGETLRFPARGGTSTATLTEDDLGVVEEGTEPVPLVTTRKLQDFELPRQIRLKYPSYDLDYEIGEQLSPSRIGTVGVNEVSLQLPVILTDARAAEIAEITFREAWASRWTHEFTLDPSWFTAEPADVMLLPVDGRNYRVRIVSINDSGLMVRRVSALRDDDGTYVSAALDTSLKRTSPKVFLIGDTTVVLLDLPPLRDEDDNAGVYVAGRRSGTGSTWQGARLHRSVDAGETYSQLLALSAQATIGTIVSAPSAGDGYTWNDAAEYVVDIVSGTLQSRTDAAVLAGANAAAVGAHGRWHVFQFANQELISAGRYRLSRLLLGRAGTEHLIGSVEVGDTFVLVSGSGIYRAGLQTSEIGVSRTYRAVTSGAAFDSGADQVFTGTGQALETYSPVYIRGSRDGGGNLTITWLRRDRLSQTLPDGIVLPMSEASEAYQVDILDGEEVVRTIDTATTSAVYTGPQQVEDFGEQQTTVTLRVYQLSATVGRGAAAEATLSTFSSTGYGLEYGYNYGGSTPGVFVTRETVAVSFSGTFSGDDDYRIRVIYSPNVGAPQTEEYELDAAGKTTVNEYATELAAAASTDFEPDVQVDIAGDVVTFSTFFGSLDISFSNNTASTTVVERQAPLASQGGTRQVLILDFYRLVESGGESVVLLSPAESEYFVSSILAFKEMRVNGLTLAATDAVKAINSTQSSTWSLGWPGTSGVTALSRTVLAAFIEDIESDFLTDSFVNLVQTGSGDGHSRIALEIHVDYNYQIPADIITPFTFEPKGGYPFDILLTQTQAPQIDAPSGLSQIVDTGFTSTFDSGSLDNPVAAGQIYSIDIDGATYTASGTPVDDDVSDNSSFDPDRRFYRDNIMVSLKTQIDGQSEYSVEYVTSNRPSGEERGGVIDGLATSVAVQALRITRAATNTSMTISPQANFGLVVEIQGS